MRDLRKPLLYGLALFLLGFSIALLSENNLGMAPWDALTKTFHMGLGISYSIISPAISILLICLAYLISWKKPSFKMVVPVIVSTIIGFSIDLTLLFIPNVSELSEFYNYLYVISALILISFALNVIIYCGYVLPALEQFVQAISKRLNISFGKAKLVGEFFAFSMAIIFGLIFNFQSQLFFMGQTTLIVLLFIGLLVDLFKKPTIKLLERIL